MPKYTPLYNNVLDNFNYSFTGIGNSMEQAKQAGAIDYLTKPFRFDEFLNKIKPFVAK